MSNKAPEDEWIEDFRYQVPEPFDRRLASVSLQITNNDLSDGLDVAANASVSPREITLNIGDCEVIVEMRIYSFELDISGGNAIVSHGPDYPSLVQETEQRFNKITQIVEQAGKGYEGTVNASDIITPSVKANIKSAKNREKKILADQRFLRQYWHHSTNCLVAESAVKDEPLHRQIISNYKGWQVRPQIVDRPYGIIARLRVEENGVTLSAIDVSGFGRMYERIKSIVSSGKTDRKFRKTAFDGLLEKLVLKKLQSRDESKFATLAADCVVVKPNDSLEHIAPVWGVKKIEIDLEEIEEFLNSDHLEIPNDHTQKRSFTNEDTAALSDFVTENELQNSISEDIGELLMDSGQEVFAFSQNGDLLFISEPAINRIQNDSFLFYIKREILLGRLKDLEDLTRMPELKGTLEAVIETDNDWEAIHLYHTRHFRHQYSKETIDKELEPQSIFIFSIRKSASELKHEEKEPLYIEVASNEYMSAKGRPRSGSQFAPQEYSEFIHSERSDYVNGSPSIFSDRFHSYLARKIFKASISTTRR